jgi:long-chain fatty acid transport protein
MSHWLRSFPLCRRIPVLFAVCTIFVISSSTTAIAGGLYLNEFGTSSMGTAGAGAQAYANDASTAFHNPAGMTRIDGRQFGAAAGLIYADIKFNPDADTPIPGGDGGSAGGFAPLVGSHYVHSVSDKLKLGMNVVAISGAVLDYDNDWSGRYLGQEITLMTITLVPGIGYRINEKFSIGGGLNITYGTLDLDAAIPNPMGPGNPDGKVKVEDADDWEVGYQFGVLFELSEDTRIGAIYFSGIEPDFSGDADIKPVGLEAGIHLKIDFPEMVRGSIYHKLNEKFALLGTLGWEKWSDLDKIPISTGGGSAAIQTNWDDVWHFAGGIHYTPNDKWMFMTGVAYDTSPAEKKYGNPLLPVDRQVRLALGTQYHWKENIDIGAAFVYADLGESRIQNDTLIGDYEDNRAVMFGLNFNWKL